MNSDQLWSMARQLATGIAVSYATKKGLDGDMAAAAMGAVFTLVSFGASVYAHWGMKKVPEKA